MKPKRVQRKRTRGWKMPPNTVYVGRPTKWGNPFKVDKIGRKKAIILYRLYIKGKLTMASMSYAIKSCGGTVNPNQELAFFQFALGAAMLRTNHLHELRGKNLACWCKPGEPCHADVLLELANR